MRKFPSIFLVARTVPHEGSIEYFAGYRHGSRPVAQWATPTNEHNPIVYEDRDTAEEVADCHPGAYVVEFVYKPN